MPASPVPFGTAGHPTGALTPAGATSGANQPAIPFAGLLTDRLAPLLFDPFHNPEIAHG
jgi:hypothetical protein